MYLECARLGVHLECKAWVCIYRVIGGISQAILRRRELSKQYKLKVLNAMVVLVLIHGCEV